MQKATRPQPTFRSIARFVWGYYGGRRPGHVVMITILLAGIAFVEVIQPVVLGYFTDYIAATAVDTPGSLQQASYWLGLALAAGVSFWVLRIGTHYYYDYCLKFPAMRDSVTDSFAQVQRLSTDWQTNAFAGATVRRLTRGMWSMERFSDAFYGDFIPIGLTLTGIITLLWLRWPEFGAIIAACTLAYAGISIWLAVRFVGPTAERAATADTALGAQLADSISGNATVKSFGREREEDQRLARSADRWQVAYWRNYFVHNTIDFVQAMLMTGIKATLFLGSVWLWSQGSATVGDVVFVIGSYNLISGYLRSIGSRVRDFQQAVKDLEDMVGFHETPLGIEDRPGARALQASEGRIEFKKVTFKYPNQKKPAFTKFDLAIQPGEKVALVGHSGAGKSTIVKLIQRLYDPQSGRIEIDGQDIAAITQESLRRAVSLVPQEPVLFHRSLAENISYGRPKATKKEIERAARQAHAHEFIAKLPQGYDTLVGERGIKLSGGERQRVAIARAILADSPILILDEATSSLDSESESLIQDALQKLMNGRTSIVVAHRLSTIKSADRILVFEGGRIVESGTHRELVKKRGGQYKKFYELQAGGFIAD